MKKILTLALCLTVIFQASAQNTAENYKSRYERLVRNLGYAGVGVDNLLNQWEELDPNDCEMLEARYNYHLTRSKTIRLVPKNVQKFLGEAPAAVIKDSLGNDVRYFEEAFFDEEEFYYANMAIDKAISLSAYELDYRIDKINALFAYEKGTPLSCVAEIKKVIDLQQKTRPAWTFGGEEVSEDDITDLIQQYCYVLFKEGTETSYQAFMDISTIMFKMYPKKLDFLCNQGSYYLVAKNNAKKAQKTYEKVIAADPGNQNALRNLILMARKSGNTAMENKYRLQLAESQSLAK